MKTLLPALAASLLCASVCACAGTTASDIPPRSTVELLPGADATLGPRAALRFDAILDSRCPPGVQCITAGKIRYRFVLSGGKQPETFILDSSAPRHVSTELAGVSVQLDSAAPPPPPASTNATSASGVAPTVHPVTLTITRQ